MSLVLTQPAGFTDSDELVKISATDTTAKYIQAALASGTGIGLAVLNSGANEQLELSLNANITDLNDVLTTMSPIDGQVLTFDTTNGWQAETIPAGVTDHTLLSNIGLNTHLQIDSHISDGSIHYTQAAISITESQISDLQSYLLDITGESIKDLSDVLTTMTPADGQVLTFDTVNGWQSETLPTGITDHTLLSNIGTNSHIQIDTHIADGTIHFTQAAISITESQISDLQSYILTSEKGAINGVATLGGDGKIPSSQIPSIAITDVYVVADILARDALTVQTGDVAKVNDIGGGVTQTYIWDGLVWIDIQETSDVISVNGQTGVVAVNLWATFNADTGTTTANATTDTLTISGGSGISTAIVGDTLTITNDTPNVDQNLFETITGDTGSTTANTTTDTLQIAGGDGITTSVVGDVVTITSDNPQTENIVTNITTTVVVDSVLAEMGKWIIRVVEVATSNILTEEILATHDGTNPKFTEYAILKMGSNITGLNINVTLTGGNTLNVTVTSTPAVDVQIKRVSVF